MLGSILDIFKSINMLALLNILSKEADDAGIAKYYLPTADKLGYSFLIATMHMTATMHIRRNQSRYQRGEN